MQWTLKSEYSKELEFWAFEVVLDKQNICSYFYIIFDKDFYPTKNSHTPDRQYAALQKGKWRRIVDPFSSHRPIRLWKVVAELLPIEDHDIPPHNEQI